MGNAGHLPGKPRHGYVDFIPLQPLPYILIGHFKKADAAAGIPLLETGNDRRQHHLPPGRGDTDAENPLKAPRHIRQLPLQSQLVSDKQAGVAKKYGAAVRQLQRHMAHKKLRPRLPLQRRHMGGQSLLGNMQPLRRLRKTSLLCQHEEIFHRQKIHGPSYYCILSVLYTRNNSFST